MRLSYTEFCKKNNLKENDESKRFFNRYRKNNPQIYRFRFK